MTEVAPAGPGSAVGAYGGSSTIGLDDVDVQDVILPRINILHKEGLFEDNLAKQKFATLDCIILGLVKQRVMWAKDTDDGDKPLCKSPNHSQGFPLVSDDVAKAKQFPWARSNFNPEDYPPEAGVNGNVTLPCANCVFQEWDKGDWKVPPCAEQHTYPILYNTTPESAEPTWSPAIVTFAKTGIKPSRAYLSSFVQARKPMFTARTRITLTLQNRGTVDYSVPNFSKVGDTDESFWEGYGEQYLQIQGYLKQPPRSEEESYEGAAGFDNANTPAPSAAPTVPSTVAQPAPAAPPAQPAAVQQPAPAAPATPAPAAPAPAPAVPPDDSGLPF